MNPPKLPRSIYSVKESPSTDEVEFEILVGQLVFILQDTEQAIRFCDLIVFHPQGAQVTTDIFRGDKRSLGRLVNKLKEKTSLDGGFQRTLEAFVENRNILIHRASEQLWWQAKNQGQFASAFAFLKDLMDQTETVKLAFEAVVFDYMNRLEEVAI